MSEMLKRQLRELIAELGRLGSEERKRATAQVLTAVFPLLMTSEGGK